MTSARREIPADEQERLAQALEDMAARVRAESVVDYSVEVENGTREVPNGPMIWREYDGRTRFAVTVQLEPRRVS